MNILVIIIVSLTLFIFYLFKIIDKQKSKIVYLSRQNTSLMDKFKHKSSKNSIENISEIEIKFLKIHTHSAFLKNTSYIRIAPFDFAPKIIDIQKNTQVKILSKILIGNEYWYEIITDNSDCSYKLKGWIKEYGVEFVYPKFQDITNQNEIINIF